MSRRSRGALVFFALLASPTQALEVRLHPADVVYVYENKGEGTPRDLHTAVLQNLAFVNTSKAELTLEEASIEAMQGSAVLLRVLIDAATLEKSAATMNAYQEQGVLEAYDFQFHTSRYLKDVALAKSRTLPPGQAIVVMRRALLFHGLPETLTVKARARRADGGAVEASASIRVLRHQSPNRWVLPVRGRWVAGGAPSLHSHDRWSGIQEFAVDFIQFGEGGLTHRGDGSKLADYHCYAQPVYAASDGVVVGVQADGVESDSRLQQPGESAPDFAQRTQAEQMKLLQTGFSRAMGNLVVIEHGGGEHSYSAHLQPGSIQVKVGDNVKAGQHIANVGHSGNSTEPHLHFHVTDGPDVAYSRSLPVSFESIELWPSDDGQVKHLHSGQVLFTTK